MSYPTQSHEEAIELLERYRSYLIHRARQCAIDIATDNKTVHSRQVRAAMKELGLLSPAVREVWLGAVFTARSIFRATGEFHVYQDDERNCHKKRVLIWELTPSFRRDMFREPKWDGELPTDDQLLAAAWAERNANTGRADQVERGMAAIAVLCQGRKRTPDIQAALEELSLLTGRPIPVVAPKPSRPGDQAPQLELGLNEGTE